MTVNEAKGCKSVTVAFFASDDTQSVPVAWCGRDHNPERTLDMLTTLTAVYAPRLFALMKDRKGISAVEYAVLAVGIVAVVAGAAATLGGKVGTVFGQVSAGL